LLGTPDGRLGSRRHLPPPFRETVRQSLSLGSVVKQLERVNVAAIAVKLRPMRRMHVAATGAALLFLFAPVAARAATVTSALGIPCAPGAGGTQQCTGTMATRVPSWD